MKTLDVRFAQACEFICSVGRPSTPEYIHQTAAYLFRNIFSGHVYHLPLRYTVHNCQFPVHHNPVSSSKLMSSERHFWMLYNQAIINMYRLDTFPRSLLAFQCRKSSWFSEHFICGLYTLKLYRGVPFGQKMTAQPENVVLSDHMFNLSYFLPIVYVPPLYDGMLMQTTIFIPICYEVISNQIKIIIIIFYRLGLCISYLRLSNP